jgi:hypothetical protein
MAMWESQAIVASQVAGPPRRHGRSVEADADVCPETGLACIGRGASAHAMAFGRDMLDWPSPHYGFILSTVYGRRDHK